jgi:hypothetical protein
MAFAVVHSAGACLMPGTRRMASENERVRSRGADTQSTRRSTSGPEQSSRGAASLTTGELLGGRYRIERELGEGGMGVVYLVSDEQVAGEQFAIKVLKASLQPEALALLHREDLLSQQCLAVVYDKLGRHTDAEAELAKIKSALGDTEAYPYAAIYAQWGGDRPRALKWLDTAMHLRDSGLDLLKTDPLLDPLRKEPRFQAIERDLKFPD